MDPAQLCPKPVDQDQQQILPLDQPFLPHNLSKAATEDTQLISSRVTDFTVARLAVNMLLLVEPEVIKQLDKVTRVVNTEDIRLSEATIMAIASSAVDGVATTDINSARVASRPGRLIPPWRLLTKLCYYPFFSPISCMLNSCRMEEHWKLIGDFFLSLFCRTSPRLPVIPPHSSLKPIVFN